MGTTVSCLQILCARVTWNSPSAAHHSILRSSLPVSCFVRLHTSFSFFRGFPHLPPSPVPPTPHGCRWRASAAVARAARERLASQLAASNPSLGRRGEGLLGARRRQKLAAAAAGSLGGGGGEEQQLLLLQGRDDLDSLAPQVRGRRA